MKCVMVLSSVIFEKLSLKNQVDIFKNNLRTPFLVFWGVFCSTSPRRKVPNEMCDGYLVQLFLKSFLLKNQVDIFKNRLRTPVLSFWGSLAPQAPRRKVPT